MYSSVHLLLPRSSILWDERHPRGVKSRSVNYAAKRCIPRDSHALRQQGIFKISSEEGACSFFAAALGGSRRSTN